MATFLKHLNSYLVPAGKRTHYPLSWCDSRPVTAPSSSCRARPLVHSSRRYSNGCLRSPRHCPPAPTCASCCVRMRKRMSSSRRKRSCWNCHPTHWSSRFVRDAIQRSLYATPNMYSYIANTVRVYALNALTIKRINHYTVHVQALSMKPVRVTL